MENGQMRSMEEIRKIVANEEKQIKKQKRSIKDFFSSEELYSNIGLVFGFILFMLSLGIILGFVKYSFIGIVKAVREMAKTLDLKKAKKEKSKVAQKDNNIA